ncbi:M24 family metallopeptidase [Candidatus Pacearchaeota archaeon]|nr:M24 family metallopeptidase [Candidatus Pacearchaeota archaeon]
MSKEKILKAGKIASEAKEYARKIIKKGMPLLEIADKIEGLENNEENKKLIQASKEALDNSIKLAKEKTQVRFMGKAIQETIESHGFSAVVNLGGHGVTHYQVHSGIMIPNFDNKKNDSLEIGQYAIEPFATNGNGKVHDGKPSGIYELKSGKNIRSPIAREVLEFIAEEYNTLPFASRWIVKKFGTKGLIGLKQLQENGNLHHYAVLMETSKGIVSQAEHTILIEKDNTIVTTE